MAPNLQAGTVLARSYRLLRPIGEGGMGRVWDAEHIALSRLVAVKVMSEEALLTPIARELFEREAKATAKVDSPHVVRVLDFDFTDDGFPFLVLERLVGETLEERIARTGALALSETATLVDHIGHAVAAAHACGILHRDIKAENIFLVRTKDGGIDARLFDFGVALYKNTRPLIPGTVGTIQYMSPEQLTAGPVDERSDVFSLAICVYYALTARLPFEGDTLQTMAGALARRCRSVLELRPDLPHALDPWFLRALARDPDARFASADEARTALLEVARSRTDRPTPLALEIDVDDRELVAAGVPKRHGVVRWLAASAMLAGVVFATMNPAKVTSAVHWARGNYAFAASAAAMTTDEPPSVEREPAALRVFSHQHEARPVALVEPTRAPSKPALAPTTVAPPPIVDASVSDADASTPLPVVQDIVGFGGRE